MVILESIRHVYKKDDIPLAFFKLLFASLTLAKLHSLHYNSFFYKFTTLCTGNNFERNTINLIFCIYYLLLALIHY